MDFVFGDSTLVSKINNNGCNPPHYIQSNVKSIVILNYNEYDATLVINSLINSIPGHSNSHTLLLKLYSYGIWGQLMNWF